jgi:hypothetical protein
MRFCGEEEEAQIVEGQVVARTEPRQPMFRPAEQRGPIYQVDPQYRPDYYQSAADGSGIDLTGLVDTGVSFASDPKSRSIAKLLSLPLFTYVALSGKMPPLVRIAALALGVIEALEIAQKGPELVDFMPAQEWSPPEYR